MNKTALQQLLVANGKPLTDMLRTFKFILALRKVVSDNELTSLNHAPYSNELETGEELLRFKFLSHFS